MTAPRHRPAPESDPATRSRRAPGSAGAAPERRRAGVQARDAGRLRLALALGAALMLPALLASCAPGRDAPASAGDPPAPDAPPPVTEPPITAPEAAGPAMLQLHGTPRQGGLLRGLVPAGTTRLTLDDTPVAFDAEGNFIIAFDRDAASAATLVARRDDGGAQTRRLDVAPGDWRIEHVNASITGGATSEEFRRRRAGELARIAGARARGEASEGWRQSFVWPVRARISGVFGSQRIYRGTPGGYHSGLDIAGGAGTAYVAPADGVVTLAAQTPFTLEGNLLIVDHGMGLNSAFLHSARLLVKEGDVVRQGQPIGIIGATGRASGPHLHWSMTWHGARIDPLPLLPRGE